MEEGASHHTGCTFRDIAIQRRLQYGLWFQIYDHLRSKVADSTVGLACLPTSRFTMIYSQLLTSFCYNLIIGLTSIEYDRGSRLIAFSDEFHGYKRPSDLILSVLRHSDSRISFLDFSDDMLS